MVHIHFGNAHGWIYCPGYAGGKEDDRADRLARKAATTNGLRLGRTEVLRSLRHYLRAKDIRSFYRLEERGVERGIARQSSLKGRERTIVNQMNIGTVSKATSGETSNRRVEHMF